MKKFKEEERFWKRYLSIILMKKNRNYYIMNDIIHYNRIFIRYKKYAEIDEKYLSKLVFAEIENKHILIV